VGRDEDPEFYVNWSMDSIGKKVAENSEPNDSHYRHAEGEHLFENVDFS